MEITMALGPPNVIEKKTMLTASNKKLPNKKKDEKPTKCEKN